MPQPTTERKYQQHHWLHRITLQLLDTVLQTEKEAGLP